MKQILKTFLLLLTLIVTACDNQKSTNSSGESGSDQQEIISSPATTEQAASIINLETFELIPASESPGQNTLANLTYQAAADVKSAFVFYQKKLIADGWKEQPNSYVTEQMASAVLLKKGFKLSITVMPASRPGLSQVMIQQHGNLDFSKLSLTSGLTALAVFPQTAIYTSSSLPADAAEACKQKLLASGWTAYGSAGETQYYKQNAVLLKVTVSASPTEPGKTTVSLTDVLMSADIPAPAFAQSIDYKDSLQTLDFNSTESKEKIFDFYRQELLKGNWKLSDYQPGQLEGKDVLIFKNSNKDTLGVRISKDASGNNRVNISFQTGSQIDQINKKLDAQATAHYVKNNS